MHSFSFGNRFLFVWTTLIVIYILAPLAVVVLISLTTYDYISLPTAGISLKWYAQVFREAIFLESAITSLLLALGAALVALVLGATASLAIIRYRFPGRTALQILSASPLFVPMVMTGLALLIAASQFGFYDQALRLLIGHSILTLPYVVRTVSASLTGFDINQELAAQNLGATPFKAFMKVTLPQLGPGLLAGAVFAFIISFDNVGLSIFLSGTQYTTLPVQLYFYTSNSSDPTAAAVSVLMILFSFSVIALMERIFGLQKLMS